MTLLPLLAVTLASPGPMRYELFPYRPAANPKATVVAGNARITVLTDRLFRFEYSSSGKFEDRPTIAFVNRYMEDGNVPAFKSSVSGGAVNITIPSSNIVIGYAGGDFSSTSLRVTAPSFAWQYGMTSDKDPGNLRGTFRTLDGTGNVTLNCTVNKKEHCEFGIVSRSGWATVDETGVPCMDDVHDWWADADGKMLRNSDDIDLYLFAHGHDYIGALKDYTTVGGKVPLLPRRNLGIWFTRWYDLANVDVRNIIHQYESRGVPLDVFILDMNWHKKNDWSGYSVDTTLYPYPEDTFSYVHSKGLALGANLHDATGIGNWEDKFQEVCTAVGCDPNHLNGDKGKSIAFDLTNTSYVFALEDIVLKAVEDVGMDFWWIDWQQGETQGNTGQDGPRHKMNPTVWTDKMRVTDSIRRCRMNGDCTDKRGVVFARWGGLGNHRYQHGFSGDVAGLKWQNLAYQTYFSATASNVGWGFWSHDIEGPGGDPEMYVRWIQLGSFSGIMRSHERGMSAGGCNGAFPTEAKGCAHVRPWEAPPLFFEANRDALTARSDLLPYIYTAAREAHDTGVGLTRPMYWYHDVDGAYPGDVDGNLGQTPSTRQYYFGRDILVAPVTSPSACGAKAASAGTVLYEPCGVVYQDVWVPPGDFVESTSGNSVSGPATLNRAYALDEVPLFFRAGAIVPRLFGAGSVVGRAARGFDALSFTVYPGASTGTTRVYEDDGETYAYNASSSYGWVEASYNKSSATSVSFEVKQATSFPGTPKTRDMQLRLFASAPATSVSVQGNTVAYARWGCTEGSCWTYDGESLEVVVTIHGVDTSASLAIDVQLSSAPAPVKLRGILRRAVLAKRNLDETRSTPGAHTPDPKGSPLSKLASLGDALAYLAGKDLTQWAQAAAGASGLLSDAIAEVSAAISSMNHNADRWKYSLDLLQTAY